MKKTLSILTALLLVACSAQKPNLVGTQEPILNITSDLAPKIQAQVSPTTAMVKNLTQTAFNMAYLLYWYDKNGVTQPANETDEGFSSSVQLEPQISTSIPLAKPTPESENYRLYLYLK